MIEWEIEAKSVFTLFPDDAEAFRRIFRIDDPEQFRKDPQMLRDAGILPSRARRKMVAAIQKKLDKLPVENDPIPDQENSSGR